MRRGMAAGAALTIAMLAAMPMQAAVGAKPYREPFRDPVGIGSPLDGEGSFSFVFPEKWGPCSYSRLVTVEALEIDWWFSDGRQVSVTAGTITLMNLETGASYVHHSDYQRTTTLRPDGQWLEVIDGKRWMGFLEGDPGPEGVVGRGGAEYFVSGTQTIVYNPRGDAITSYELDGRAVDSCEVLA